MYLAGPRYTTDGRQREKSVTKRPRRMLKGANKAAASKCGLLAGVSRDIHPATILWKPGSDMESIHFGSVRMEIINADLASKALPNHAGSGFVAEAEIDDGDEIRVDVAGVSLGLESLESSGAPPRLCLRGPERIRRYEDGRL